MAQGATPIIAALKIEPNDSSDHPLETTTKILSVLSDDQVQRIDSSRRKLELTPLPLDLIALTRAAAMRVITPNKGEIIPTTEFQANFYRWDTETKTPAFIRRNNKVQAFYEINPQLTFLT